jgi:hypothetical protein
MMAGRPRRNGPAGASVPRRGRAGSRRGQRPRGGETHPGDANVGKPLARALAAGGRRALLSKGLGGARCKLTRPSCASYRRCWTLAQPPGAEMRISAATALGSPAIAEHCG